MNLFERIQYRLNEEPNDSKSQNKKSSRKGKNNQSPDYSETSSKTGSMKNRKPKVSTDVEGLGNRQGRQDATNPKKGGYSRVEDSLDNKPSGKTKLGNTTQGGPVKTFFDKDKAKAKREKLLQGRQDYIDPKTNKASKEGIKRYISKARNMASGTNANNKANQKAAEVISKSAGKEYASKINKKYGGTLAKTRKVSDSTFKKIQKKINIKSPVRTSPVSGQLIPLKGKELRDYKRQLQQQQQPQSGPTTTTKPKVIKKTKIKGAQQPKDLAKELEKLKKNLKNPVDKSFGDALKKNQTPKPFVTPGTQDLEKIKPKVTTSKNLGKLSQTKLGSKVPSMQLSKRLMKHKNKYAVAAGLALAGGAYLLGRNRVASAKTKEKKAIAAFNKKEANKPKEMVDVQLFLNRTGTPPKPSTSKFKSVYDKNYIKNLKSKNTTPKTTTPKNNPVSKYTSGVSNAAKRNAALPYDSNKIASYAKPSQRSSKK